MVENLFLHPAILIASGFDCLTSSDVRFLNACKKHFDPIKDNFAQVILITPMDFELGGILNPEDQMIEPVSAYRKASERIPDFPYLNKYQILKYIYEERLEMTFQKIIQEVLASIKKTLGFNDFNIARLFDTPNTSSKAIKLIQKTDVYTKVNALHQCGVGNRLTDAFAWVFYKYKIHHLD
jgi:hypothetical protein